MNFKKLNLGKLILDKSHNLSMDVVKISSANSLEHELAKTKLAYMLIKRGLVIYTEAIFSNGRRADIYCPETGDVFEVLHSETKEMFEAKKKEYPVEVNVFGFKAKDVLKEDFCI